MSPWDVQPSFVEHIKRVAYGNERIVLPRQGKGVVAPVSMADAEFL